MSPIEKIYDLRFTIYDLEKSGNKIVPRKSYFVHFPLRALTVLFLLLFPLLSQAQNTRTGETTSPPPKSNKTKVLIVPWEPRMFNCNSDITSAISRETGQRYSQVQEALRKGMVERLKAAFGSGYNVISLIDDTAKMNKDLHYVYTCTSISYTPVNFPLNPTKADSAKLKKPQPGIQKGQIQAEEDEVDKFMNTIVLSPNLLTYLKKKYGAEYVLFINEIDLDNDLGADAYNLQGKQEFNRYAIAHWTIFNATTGKRVAMGKSRGNFSSAINTPKKIIDAAFATIAKAIFDKFLVGIKPKE